MRTGGPPTWGARAAPSRQGGTADADLLAALTPGGGGLTFGGWDADLGGGERISILEES